MILTWIFFRSSIGIAGTFLISATADAEDSFPFGIFSLVGCWDLLSHITGTKYLIIYFFIWGYRGCCAWDERSGKYVPKSVFLNLSIPLNGSKTCLCGIYFINLIHNCSYILFSYSQIWDICIYILIYFRRPIHVWFYEDMGLSNPHKYWRVFNR